VVVSHDGQVVEPGVGDAVRLRLVGVPVVWAPKDQGATRFDGRYPFYLVPKFNAVGSKLSEKVELDLLALARIGSNQDDPILQAQQGNLF
jgi:hypothetical protein